MEGLEGLSKEQIWERYVELLKRVEYYERQLEEAQLDNDILEDEVSKDALTFMGMR
jgi:hypothetical protein